MECNRVLCCVIALTLVILNFIALTLAAELSEPENIVLFLGDENKLQVDYRTQHSLNLLPGSLNLYFYNDCTDKKPNDCKISHTSNRHSLRLFSETKINECLKFESIPMSSPPPNYSLTFCVVMRNIMWNGGVINQAWPLNNHTWIRRPFVTNYENGQSVIEYYFYSSDGFFFYFNDSVPLFITINSGKICFTAKGTEPFYKSYINMKYHVCKYNNPREAHKNAVKYFLGKPENKPYDYKSMVENAIWSTRTKDWSDMNASVVQSYVNEIKNHSVLYGTIEIDNYWENCFCNSGFNKSKLEKLAGIVKGLNGFKVSLWITPFISVDCENHCKNISDIFVKTTSNNAVIKTWSDKDAYYVDFTNPNASYWWGNETQKLLTETGINTLIFVGGESSWYPKQPNFYINGTTYPDNINAYLETMMRVGSNTQYKSSRRGQRYGHFLRLLNYNTSGNMTLELSMLVSSLIHSNMLGYPFVIPNMIGKNNNEPPSTNLYIRWMQAVTFMPVIHYSYTPWDFDKKTIDICKKIMNIRKNHTNTIIDLMENSVAKGSPLNPPIWWIDPTNSEAYSIDDEYLLGEKILVAPVLDENANTRHVYLPNGFWRDENNPDHYLEGRKWYYNYQADINILPWFTRLKDQ